MLQIKNAHFVTAETTQQTDIWIEDEKIVQIGGTGPKEPDEILDAEGQIVMPGGIDVHTHFDLDVGIATATDSFYTGSVAAACGGTTTIVDHMAFGPKGCALRHQVDVYHQLADGEAVIDYGFHGVLQHVNDQVLQDMETLIEEGITSYKAYLTYADKLNDDEVFRVLQRCKELGLMLTVHPENDGVVNYLRTWYPEHGYTAPKYHPLSRPAECEAEAENRMMLFAHMAGDAPLYIVHLSNRLGLQYAQMARQRGQKNLYLETCPQYLFLDDSQYDLPDHEGLKYMLSPPLRTKQDQKELWRGIADGSIQTIATDHCPFFFHKEKQMGKDDFTKCPNGIPGVETRMMLLFSEGVMKKRISENRFVEICCTNPAKLFGLYPQKGSGMMGADADLIFIDPNQNTFITKSILHENVDYTVYEGMEMRGKITKTMLRGQVIAENGEFLGKKGDGRFMKRRRPMLMDD